MDGKQIVLFIIPLVALTIVIEYLLGKLIFKRRLYRLNAVLTDISIGITNLVAGLFLGAFHVAVYFYIEKHWSLMDLPVSDWRSWVVTLILYDFLYYWCHYYHHKVNILWGNHIIHHTGEDFNYSLAVRLSALGGLTVWLFFMPVMALLGIPLELYGAIAGLQVFYQYFIHTTLVPELGFLEKIFVTPSQHRIHHAKNPQYIDKNFGCFFVIWDRLFGTYQRELKDVEILYGITRPIKSFMPEVVNFKTYYDMFKAVLQKKSLHDRFNILFGSPIYLNTDGKEAEVSPEKYDPKVASCYFPYIVGTYIPVFLLACHLMLNFTVLSNDILIGLCTAVVISMNLIGSLLKGRKLNLNLEIIRHVLLIAVVILLLIDSPEFSTIPLITFLFLCISLLLLSRAVKKHDKASFVKIGSI